MRLARRAITCPSWISSKTSIDPTRSFRVLDVARVREINSTRSGEPSEPARERWSERWSEREREREKEKEKEKDPKKKIRRRRSEEEGVLHPPYYYTFTFDNERFYFILHYILHSLSVKKISDVQLVAARALSPRKKLSRNNNNNNNNARAQNSSSSSSRLLLLLLMRERENKITRSCRKHRAETKRAFTRERKRERER